MINRRRRVEKENKRKEFQTKRKLDVKRLRIERKLLGEKVEEESRIWTKIFERQRWIKKHNEENQIEDVIKPLCFFY